MRKKRRIRTRNTSRKVSITALFVFIVIAAIGYATVNSSIRSIGATEIKESSWDIHLDNLQIINGTLEDNESISINDAKDTVIFNAGLDTIDDYFELTVDVVNNGQMDAMLSDIQVIGLSDAQENYLDFYYGYIDERLDIGDKLSAGERDVILIKIKYEDGITLDEIPNNEETINLSLGLTYESANKTAKSSGKLLYDEIAKTAQPDTSINFSALASPTNGNGLFRITSTENDAYPILFYRGNVTNNVVAYANKCWLMVRTTEKGGIKLLYGGRYSFGSGCTDIDDTSLIGPVNYNPDNEDNAYGGYMYGQTNSSTYEETHANIYDSIVKTTIDTWYEDNIKDWTDIFLEDAVWCNDREGLSFGTTQAYTNNFNRAMDGNPTLACSNENDRFTVSEKNGNGMLKYPIGLINSNEAVYAGLLFGDQVGVANHYMYYGDVNYWLLNPNNFTTQYKMSTFIIQTMGNGKIALSNTSANDSVYVRPSVVLRHGTKYHSGDGTLSNPYIIAIEG